MTRELHRRGTRSLHHPVLVIEGARGYGKTAFVDAQAKRFDQHVPCARISFEQHRAATVPEALSAIAFQLSKTCERYGSLRFPLLAIGRKAMAADLPESRPEALQKIKELLAAEVDVDGMREILRDASGVLGPELGPVIRVGASVVTEALRRVVRRAKSLNPEWYGHRDRGDRNEALDVLVDLNSWVREKRIPEINELLWEAFLADLRENFQNSAHAAEMTLNCLVLLDDVDTPLGQKFIHGLVDARRIRQARGTDPADPMTVVVTSRGELLAGMRDEPDWWRRYTLPDLSEDETGAMVSARPSRSGGGAQLISGHQLTLMVHGLAGGHPMSTSMLVDAMGERPLEHGDTLAVLLDRRVPGHDPDRPLLGDLLRQRLLGEFTEDVDKDLVTCAAARTKQHASVLAAHGDLLAGGINRYQEDIHPLLWPASGGAGPVVLRRLLLRQLAARVDGEAPDWTKVAGWFRARCVHDGDEDGVLHYAMADGDITATCEGLRQRLVGNDPTDWVRLLRSVTSMPRRPADPDVSPMDQLRAAVDTRSPRLARLVVAMWIAADPFVSNRRRTLHRQISADYNFVAGLAQGDPEPLLNEADHHRRQAELWS